MAKNTILGRTITNVREEITATAVAITPGHMVERTSAGLCQKHSTAGGAAEGLFAIEDAHQGKGITDNYAVSVPIQIACATKGEQIYAVFDATSGGSAAIGDFLESAGDGTLRKWVAPPSAGAVEVAGSIVGVALEAVTAGNRFLIQIV